MPLFALFQTALRRHWRVYLAEAGGLAWFVVSASLLTVALEHPASSLHRALPGATYALLRRSLLGLGMGLVVAGNVYSPWGKQSGAHLNPAITLAFWRLGRISTPDAVLYALAQGLGALAAALGLKQLLGAWYAHPSVHYVTTQPGPAGTAAAVAAEFSICFLLVLLVLRALRSARWQPAAGWLTGGLLMVYIMVETPYSGMSLNPARSLASAVAAGEYDGLWVYFVAPLAGATLAAALTRRHSQRLPFYPAG